MSADPTGHLLVADDDRINHHLLGRQLEKDGHTVSVAENGRRALEMLEEEDFDLVLLDIVMPEMDGMEVLEKVRETRSEAELPVIMVTSRSERVHVVKALEMGANDYITKPIDLAV
ncbi:response regulator, partial [bacterium]|nr:response regulator [bacterium]